MVYIRRLLRLMMVLFLVSSSLAIAQDLSTWEAIQERDSFRLGVASSDPWYFKDPLTNEWSGLGILLGEALAEDLGVELELVETTYGNAASALQANRIDVMFVLDATPERAKSIDFLDSPLFYYSLAVLHDESTEVTTWDKLNDPSINLGVTLGTSIDSYLTERLPKANISRYPSNNETVASFQSGRSDVVSMFAPALTMLQLRVGRGVITLPKPIQANPTSAGFRYEEDSRWSDYLNETLSAYYESGKTQALYEQYLESRGIDPATVPSIDQRPE